MSNLGLSTAKCVMHIHRLYMGFSRRVDRMRGAGTTEQGDVFPGFRSHVLRSSLGDSFWGSVSRSRHLEHQHSGTLYPAVSLLLLVLWSCLLAFWNTSMLEYLFTRKPAFAPDYWLFGSYRLYSLSCTRFSRDPYDRFYLEAI